MTRALNTASNMLDVIAGKLSDNNAPVSKYRHLNNFFKGLGEQIKSLPASCHGVAMLRLQECVNDLVTEYTEQDSSYPTYFEL